MRKETIVEPQNLEGVLARIESDHFYTLKTLEFYQERGIMHGGYSLTYELIAQRGYFAQTIGQDFVREGLELVKEEKQLERKAQRKIIAKRKYKEPLGRKSLGDYLEGFSPGLQDQICGEVEEEIKKDPLTIKHFQKQKEYEERLIAYLKEKLVS